MSRVSRRRVGLITLHRGTNFGSALQTFATYNAVERLGCDCTLIDYLYPTRYHLVKARRGETQNRISKMKLFFSPYLALPGVLKNLVTGRFFPYRNQKSKFEAFLDSLKKTRVYDMESIKEDPPAFDIYLTGSDQTWNPRYLHHDYSFLLEFAPDNGVKISYAASFGANQLLPEYQENYQRLLKRYDRVSVREESGTYLFRTLTGRGDAVCLLDPTFLLDQKQWMLHVKNAERKGNNSYVLCYIMGYVFNPYPEILNVIERVEEATGYDVLFLGFHKAAAAKGYKTIIDAGPEDFLSLFANASFVITTSFHGTAFSINFRKNFLSIVNPNPSKDDRVVNILSLTGLDNRGIVLGSSIDPVLKDMKVNYAAGTDQKVQELRDKSKEFLKDALAVER